jgi:hypothetical protein
MRFPYFALLGVLTATMAGTVACGSVTKAQSSAATTGGTGGEGAGGATTTASSTTATSSSTGIVDAGSDVNNGMISTTYPAPHPTPPTVITGDGPVLGSPRLVPVFFSNEDPTYQASLTDFVANIGTGSYWTATTSEYSVGPATSTAPVILTEAAPAMLADSDIQTWLAGKLDGNDPLWPVADDNTLYVLFYPSGTSISLASQGMTAYSCQTFGGYHDAITLDTNHASLNVAYAVVPQCGDFDGIHGADAVSAAGSHEIIEGSTDPYPSIDPAWAQTDNAHIYWDLALGGGEVGDMCAQFPGVFTKFAGLNHTVQRTWSNKAALAGHDPCVPELPGEVYFNSVPVLPDNITVNLGESITMKGVKIPVGSSKTIDIDLFSDGPTGGPWEVSAQDYNELMGEKASMTFSFDRTSGQNGEILHLTITSIAASQYGLGIFLLTSSLGQTTSAWVGLVGN